MATGTQTKITPEDLEKKFRTLQGEVQGAVDDKKPAVAGIAAGGGLLLLILVFLIGKRSGKRRSSIVEIRRI
jgi:hypothetical protein